MSLRAVLCAGAMLGLACFTVQAEAKQAPKPRVVSVNEFFDPNSSTNPQTIKLIELMKKDPTITVTQWSGIQLPGGKSGLMMSIAGNTAPDISGSWFHLIRNEIKQGFLYPLNEWIGYDKNGNGEIDDDEAIWEPWKKIPKILRKVATVDGKVYGIPQPSNHMVSLVYRKDMVETAGLDPNNPPKTWNELIRWCRVLTNTEKHIPGAVTQKGQCGICLPTYGFMFLPWIQSAGVEPVIQIKTSPKTGKEYTFSMNDVEFKTPEGEDLAKQPSTWKLNFDAPEALAALDLFYTLRWGKWVSIDGKPYSLEEANEKGLKYEEKDIVTGCARVDLGQRGEGAWDMFSRGEVAFMITFSQDLQSVGSGTNIDPDLVSWCPFPAADTPKGRRVIQTQNHYGVMYPGVADRPKEERDAVWKVLTTICDSSILDTAIETKVLSGMARFVAPKELRRLKYDEYIRDIPLAIQKNFEDLETGKIIQRTEPWVGFWFLVDGQFPREITGIMLGTLGENFDYRGAMLALNKKANSGLMFSTPESVLKKWRPIAVLVLVVVICTVLTLAFFIIRSFWKKRSGGSRSVYKGYLPFLLILPALLLILLWSYYPLCRGLVMAFQDFKVTGDSTWVGMDNFINLCLDRTFWMSLVRTCYFVFLNMLLAFTAPIILAILLTEIRHLKIFFRTLFFLPQMTSGLVIALMWKLMYNPTPAGFFNQMLSYLNVIPGVNFQPQAWLNDPSQAMICCIIPTVWASMGMSSLLYLAALHSIPPDLYEAADVDGAGFRSKLWNITIPTLLPLIIISFVGTFIATFQNMGNIFLMTFGGPGEATMVIGLKIWIEAYVNLRFGMATAMACMLGTVLIGLTYIQIKFLGKVEYKRAAD